MHDAEVEAFDMHLERLKLYFDVSHIPENEKLNGLCLYIGPEKYKILRETLSSREIKIVRFRNVPNVFPINLLQGDVPCPKKDSS